MKIKELLQVAKKFAQAFDPYDSNLRDNIINQPLEGVSKWPWRTIATAVLKDLTALDPNEQDSVITASSHKILDILNDTKVPDANALITAADSAFNTIKTKSQNNQQSLPVVSFFVNLTNKLVNKYFGTFQHADLKSKTNEVSVDRGSQNPLQTKLKQETISGFLTRTYQTLHSGKQLTPADVAQFNANKSFYVRRLNGLKGLTTRTPAQEQEKYIIEYTLSKVV